MKGCWVSPSRPSWTTPTAFHRLLDSILPPSPAAPPPVSPQELFLQGDRERALGQPISPLMDRTNAGIQKSQTGFFKVVALPMYQVGAHTYHWYDNSALQGSGCSRFTFTHISSGAASASKGHVPRSTLPSQPKSYAPDGRRLSTQCSIRFSWCTGEMLQMLPAHNAASPLIPGLQGFAQAFPKCSVLLTSLERNAEYWRGVEAAAPAGGAK